jgi:hypothetical protein
MENNIKELKKFNCIECDYHTSKCSDWLKHIESKKHIRRGQKKTTQCKICEHDAYTHWNLKLHILSQHSTIEERQNSKFYCSTCDQIFFCKLYMDNHFNGIKHKNMVKSIEYQKIVNEEDKQRACDKINNDKN